MSVDPNRQVGISSASDSFTENVYKALGDPLAFPQAFTQWIYAIVSNPTFAPQARGSALIAAPLSQAFTDSGHTDFFSQGTYVVEVQIANSIIGGALIFCGLNTGGSHKTVVILASGVAADGVSVTFSVQNNNSSTAVFRTLTAGATGGTVTVTYRRTTVTS